MPSPIDQTSDPDERRLYSPGRTLLWLLVFGSVATALSTGRLLQTAERQPFTERREVLVSIADFSHQRAKTFWLDRPGLVVDAASGRGDQRDDPPLPIQPQQLPSQPNELASSPPASSEVAAPHKAATPEPHTNDGGIGDQRSTTNHHVATTDPSTSRNRSQGSHGKPPASTEPPTPASSPARLVTNEFPLRIWAGGDSLGEYVGNQLLHSVADPDLTAVAVDYHISTGLARPDYFDWPGRINTVMQSDEPPEALVFMVGGNDDQNMSTPTGVVKFNTTEWEDEYRLRVGSIMDSMAATDAHMWWIGLPPMRDDRRIQLAETANSVASQESEKRPWTTYIDIDPLFRTEDGAYSARITGPDGETRTARAPDGVHVTSGGSEWISALVWGEVASHWKLEQAPANANTAQYSAY